MRRGAPFTLLVPLALVSIAARAAGPVPEGGFWYVHAGAPVRLAPSPRYAAALVSDELARQLPLRPPAGWVVDPRGQRQDLAARGLNLFRLPLAAPVKGLEPNTTRGSWTDGLAAGLEAEPVFECGNTLAVPLDEVLVAFAPGTTPLQARRAIRGQRGRLGIRQVRRLRGATFLVTIERAAAGRALESSRTLAALPRVLWAEPNFARIVLETPAEVPPLALVPPGPAAPMFFLPPRALEAPPGWRQMAHWERPRQLGDWYVLVDGHFEDDAPGWSQAHAAGAPRVEPGVTEYRARGGRRSVYMTQSELDGKRAPGPYAGGADAFLLSPVFALAGYADAYIELWFWARFEDAAGDPPVARDFARVRLLDGISGRFVLDRPIAPVEWSGDIALGAPGELGWRRLVFQVPPELMGPALVLVVEFVSDPADAAEGLYLDDIRVLARERGFALRTPTDPLAGREWFLAPGQQVASHPAPAENVPGAAAAWKHGHVADELVLALLDDGVERGHPDLAFWVPDDGVPLADPGEPAEPGDRHGTACAGIAAALADNAAGVAGVAQGTLLFPLRRGLDDAAIAASVDEAARRGARVLAFPWGWRETPAQVVADAISDAVARGVIVVAAAGDRPAGAADDPGVDFPCSLAATTPLVCVGAASPAGEPKGAASADGQYWWRSAAGATVIAPGTWLATTDRRGPLGYNDGSGGVPADWTATFGGSGAATCHVAGLAALMLSRDPELEPVRLGQMLRASAIPALPGAPGIVAPEPAVAAAVQSANARRESTR